MSLKSWKARAYWGAVGQPGKQVSIARSHAYHGMNAYGTSLGGIPANTENLVIVSFGHGWH